VEPDQSKSNTKELVMTIKPSKVGTIPAPFTMFGREDRGNTHEMNWQVMCPVCRFEYVHMSQIIERVRGKDNYEAWEGRGDLIRIPFNCEEGHSWDLCFGEHKGMTFAFLDGFAPTKNHRDDVDEECPKCGADLKVKSGKYGYFVGCSGYPECKHTEPYE
jgi:hypothetical protein|tara:strand:+ start:37 stop:516 length:480 start_codon:yes stop_codon:yes gene_type:complete